MARAQAQAQNAASFQAMGQAQQEQMNQAQMANMFGGMGVQAGGLQNQIGQSMGALGNQQAQLGMNQASMLANIGAQQGALGQQAYQNQFTPMQQQLNAVQVGNQGGSMAQTGQLTGTGYGAQLGLGGIQAQVNADTAASQLYGNIIGAVLNNANTGGENGGGFLQDIYSGIKDYF